jgi:hypothetical protein
MLSLLLSLLFAAPAGAVDELHRKTASQSVAWGPSTAGLRVGISASSRKLPATGADFRVTLENTGISDFVVNLGILVANGKFTRPDAVRLLLTGPGGSTRELHFTDRRYGVIAGRVDAFTVTLPAGVSYSFSTSLEQYWSPATREFALKLTPGRYSVAARFEGREGWGNLDTPWVALLHFWRGTAQSGTAEFEVSAN